MAKFRVWVSTDKVGSKCDQTVEIADEDLAEMSENDINHFLYDEMLQMINWDHERID